MPVFLNMPKRSRFGPRQTGWIDKSESNQYNAFCVQCSTQIFCLVFVTRRCRNRRMTGLPSPVTDRLKVWFWCHFLHAVWLRQRVWIQPLAT